MHILQTRVATTWEIKLTVLTLIHLRINCVIGKNAEATFTSHGQSLCSSYK